MRYCIEIKNLTLLITVHFLQYCITDMPVTLRLKELREVKGWSQAELARRADVNQAIISRLESGTTKSVNFRNLEKLALALGCSPGYLVMSTQAIPERRVRKLGKRVRTSRLA